MFVWRKRASSDWLAANERIVMARAGGRLVIVNAPRWKRCLLEIADRERARLHRFRDDFGGQIVTLPRDWRKRCQSGALTRPLVLGKRLVIAGAAPDKASALPLLVVPAGAAFGTGEHATTAMSLRLLEQISRSRTIAWSMLDLGTGSGVLALAGKMLGAQLAIGIDIDPVAIRTAKANARMNRIKRINFRTGDARALAEPGEYAVVSANLFSELLIEILPRIARAMSPGGLAILSGIMRDQEKDIKCALGASGLRLRDTRRRGKWIAILAQKQI